MAQRETTGPNGHTFATLLLMVQKSGVHQLSLVVYPTIYRVLYIPGGAGFLPSTVGFIKNLNIFYRQGAIEKTHSRSQQTNSQLQTEDGSISCINHLYLL